MPKISWKSLVRNIGRPREKAIARFWIAQYGQMCLASGLPTNLL
jgi:hypothetical protein